MKRPSYDGIYKKQHVSANKVSANNLGEIYGTQQKGWPIRVHHTKFQPSTSRNNRAIGIYKKQHVSVNNLGEL